MIGDRDDGEIAMREIMKMVAIGVTAAFALGLVGAAQAQVGDSPVRMAQVQKKKKTAAPRRAPTRIIVRPVLPYRLDSTPYPRTDNLGYPGPNAVRQCTSWLATEHRPSGTVVVPYMRCWWQRG
jgi:hypothetical protein